MAENNIDKALAYLGTSISTLVESAREPIDLSNLHTRIAKRSLTGDHISGGTVINFASTGIKDSANSQQLTISDSGITVQSVTSDKINAKIISVDVLEVKELKTNNASTQKDSLDFVATADSSLNGKGLLFKGQGTTKQFIFSANPDKFLSTEHIELVKDREFRIDGTAVLKSNELGAAVVKSNLREVGRLKGLIVDGSVSINQYMYYNANTDRLGIGTEDPNAAISIVEDGMEVVLGTSNSGKGIVGTYADTPFDIITDNTARISISTRGGILLGNRAEAPIEVHIHGKMAVGVKSIDSRVDLHVAGPIKFDERVHQYSASAPDSGTHTRGDIIWNSEPESTKYVGWVCIRAGSPGSWAPFGEIKHSN
jgi:hypothetical protein